MRVLLTAAMTLGLQTVLPWPLAADLDPAIQADLHLVQAEDYIKQKNYAAAHEAMGRILALQKTHDLTIPDEFHFRYARVLDLAGKYEQAVAAVTRYLQIAGRGGAHYREALTLLHTATQSAQDAAEAEAAANALSAAAAKAEADARDKAEAAARAEATAVAVIRDMAMVVIPAGSYVMGSPSSEAGRWGDEGPQHRVTISESFAVGAYEVTFEEWDACVSAGGCDGHIPDDRGWGRGRRPVINVSWEDAQRFVAWLRRVTGEPYRLLSEAESEYVARAGTTTPFHTGSTISASQANYDGGYTYGNGRTGVYRQKTVEVGSFPPNGFGLHDVHGNVLEWVEDCWNDGYRGAPSDGVAWAMGDCGRRVVRGGSWGDSPEDLRSASRSWSETGDRYDDVGFRVAWTLTGRHSGEARRLREQKELRPGVRFRDCEGCPELVVLPAGSFMMGSPASETGRHDYEGPQHSVTIGEPFAVGVYEVTRGEFGRFVAATGHAVDDRCSTYEGYRMERTGRSWRSPGYEQTDEHPVVCVAWEDARAYARWLSEITGRAYRLLSEAEWEYAARAGTRTAGYWGDTDEAEQCRHANGADRSSGLHRTSEWTVSCDDGYARTAPVGSYTANGFGLHDVVGNVWELVDDCWNESYAGAPSDGSTRERGHCDRRAIRGGAWGTSVGWALLRSALRWWYDIGNRGSGVGFRVARGLLDPAR